MGGGLFLLVGVLVVFCGFWLFTGGTGVIGSFNALLAFRRSEKLPFLVLLAEGLALLADEVDLPAELGWILAVGGGLPAERELLEVINAVRF